MMSRATPETPSNATDEPSESGLPAFTTFQATELETKPSLPAQVTAVPVPISPSSASPSGGSLTQLTQLTPSPLTPLQPALTALPNSNFHTLAAVNVQTTRGYPIVPAPIQARDIPGMQQQYIDERHIQLYQPITTTATFHHPQPPQPHQGIVTVLKNEHINFDLKNGIHHTSFQSSPMMNNSSFMDTPSMTTPKVSNKNGINGTPSSQVTKETRKKERRKIRASSLESSTESDTSSAMDIDGNSSGNPGQVAAVSSTDNFKSPMHSSMDNGDQTSTGEKQKQKKRKRCGECIGCQKKDNCGECAPCRNDKSHQICKQRRCEKLTEKKVSFSFYFPFIMKMLILNGERFSFF
ncbi:CLUMA_CG021429, isoform A [Clunio marinus]|uniref:CLUMA_CG021429, isoform A n=1 Tax=Clunio marinus TaxID=568069 RepID=A0A1J1J9Z8_9DIPT|nr:CLUMA_CG021429, isoform A [Clunio marinus]